MQLIKPKYIKHYDDKLNILICQIKIWDPSQYKEQDILTAPNQSQCLTLHEVESIEINQSYRELISTATVCFPRGTIIKKFETAYSANSATEVGDNTAQPGNKDKTKNSNYSTMPDGSTKPIIATVSDMGVLEVVRNIHTEHELTSADIKVGSRIQIIAGYTDDANYAENKFPYEDNPSGKYDGSSSDKTSNKLTMIFTGYVSKISAATPIELECEDLAYMLKKKSCPKINDKKAKVNDFVFPDGKHYLLKGCNLPIHDDVKKENIQIGWVEINKDLVVADVFAEWSKSGLFCYMYRNAPRENPKLRIGRAYFSDTDFNNKTSMMNRDSTFSPITIQMDWDAANDGLNIINVDPKFIAVEATGNNDNNGFIKEVIIPETDPNAVKPYRVVNERETHKRKVKKAGGNKNTKTKKQAVIEVREHVDLSNYTRITYISPKVHITKEQLAADAWSYFKHYNPNGISGDVTVFGDLDIQPSDIVAILDKRQPVRNGFYLVEEVQTTFGVNGYRRKLTLPYKVKNFDLDDSE